MGNSTSKDEAHEAELLDLSLILITLELITSHLHEQQTLLHELLAALEKNEKWEMHKQNREKEKEKPKRKTFTQITASLRDNQFHRVFRMNRSSFVKFCSVIESQVGEDTFRSERKIHDANQTEAATNFRGGEVSGETRVAILLRLLAGASYLDLFMIYDVSSTTVYRSFQIAMEWVNESFSFPFVEALRDENEVFFNEISHQFSLDSGGEFEGCIGALDGLAVKIKRPTVTDSLTDPGAYHCRKGFYALNCQAICDVSKKVLWISSRHIGTCHDSRAIKDTQLYLLLKEKEQFLTKFGFFIVGDSAYDMESFLLVPHEHPQPQSPEDAYNFWHSNSRIRIECTFGELIMRFGIFWRALNMDLRQAGDIISAASLIHNFIVDERKENAAISVVRETEIDEDEFFQNFSVQAVNSLDTVDQLMENFEEQRTHFEFPDPNCSDNNEPHDGGRPSKDRLESKAIGKKIRQLLTLHLDIVGRKRPTQKGYKYNDLGMVYMDY